jgi:hypothetical protein
MNGSIWDARDAQLVLDQLMIEDDKMEKLVGCLSQPVGLCFSGLARVLDGWWFLDLRWSGASRAQAGRRPIAHQETPRVGRWCGVEMR